ncbi:MAG TPA: hypothetical protein VK932_28035 [Kofleriaceae bacterium]|nr:hypothetical protein [Kofleriaceae bacterium]
MHRRVAAVVVLAALGASAACSKASNEAQTRQWPEPPPAKDVSIPAKLEIAVTVDGAARPAITADTLRGVPPDYADDERKAWKILSLVAEAGPPGVVEATSPAGVSVKFAHPTPDGLEPVLFLTRRGEVIVAALDPKDPFPRYHGQGGRLHRAGDQMPRVAPVSKLDITRSRP